MVIFNKTQTEFYLPLVSCLEIRVTSLEFKWTQKIVLYLCTSLRSDI